MGKTLVMEIPSETKTDLFYGIFLDSDGCFSCDCKSYFYTSQKIENFRCKHIKQFLSVQEMRDL